MNEITDQTTDVTPADFDFDVEGHGFKEIAIGLGAATIVAGSAGTAALALDDPAPGTTGGVQSLVAGAQGDVEDRLVAVDGTVAGARELAGGAVSHVARIAGDTADTAITAVQPVGAAAAAAVTSTTDLVGDLVTDPMGTTDRVTDEALGTVRATRDAAVTTARTTAADTAAFVVETADNTASTATRALDRTAHDATTLAGSTIDSAYKALDPSVEMDSDTVTVNAAGKRASVTVRLFASGHRLSVARHRS